MYPENYEPLMEYIKEDLNGENYHRSWFRKLNSKDVNSPIIDP